MTKEEEIFYKELLEELLKIPAAKIRMHAKMKDCTVPTMKQPYLEVFQMAKEEKAPTLSLTKEK